MRPRATHHHHPAAKVNVTPLIDVVMVLIIFYLIVGNLARVPMPKVALPGSGRGDATDAPAALVLTVVPEGDAVRVVIDGVAMSVEDLPAMLRSRIPDPAQGEVHLRADRALAYGRIAPIIEACRAAGLTSVKLVARRDAP